MCYYDYSNGYGLSKYIKGSQMQSRNNNLGYNQTKINNFGEAGKHSFEVRIDLNQKFLRVGSLPDYSTITELDDPNKIDPKVDYRFFLSMCNSGDIMRITSMRTVSKFDEKM